MRRNFKLLLITTLLITLVLSLGSCGNKEVDSEIENAESTADNVDKEIKEQFLEPINELIETYRKGENVEGVQPDFPEGVDFPNIQTTNDFRADYNEEQGVYFVIIDLDKDEKVMMIVISPSGNNEKPFIINGVGFSDETEESVK